MIVATWRRVAATCQPAYHLCHGRTAGRRGLFGYSGRWAHVQRPQTVRVEALNENGAPVTIVAADALAKCLCHEIDHLDGIVLADRAPIMSACRNAPAHSLAGNARQKRSICKFARFALAALAMLLSYSKKPCAAPKVASCTPGLPRNCASTGKGLQTNRFRKQKADGQVGVRPVYCRMREP